MNPPGDDTAPRVQVISRVGQILRALRDEPAGLPLADVVTRTALAKSTAYRLLLALEQEELVESVEGRFRIGRALGSSGLSRNEALRQALLPLMRRLAAQVQETVGVGVLVGDGQVQFIEQLRWDSELSVGAIVGELYPADLSACGKSLLAGAEGSQELLAYDREGFHAGICGLATFALMSDGAPVSIGIVVPSGRFESKLPALSEQLLAARPELAQIAAGV